MLHLFNWTKPGLPQGEHLNIFFSAACDVDYQCRNLECVPYGYVCDRMNDCGCEGNGCDESGCGGLGMRE